MKSSPGAADACVLLCRSAAYAKHRRLVFLETLRRLDAVTQLSGTVPASVCAAVLAAPLAMGRAEAEPELDDASYSSEPPPAASMKDQAAAGVQASAMRDVDSAAQQTASDALAEPAAELADQLQMLALQQGSSQADQTRAAVPDFTIVSLPEEDPPQASPDESQQPGSSQQQSEVQLSAEELADVADHADLSALSSWQGSELSDDEDEEGDDDDDDELEASPHAVQAGRAGQTPALADAAAYYKPAHLCDQQVRALVVCCHVNNGHWQAMCACLYKRTTPALGHCICCG